MSYHAAIEFSHERDFDVATITQGVDEVRLCVTAESQLIDPTNCGSIVIAFGADCQVHTNGPAISSTSANLPPATRRGL